MQLRECAQDASAPPPPVDPVYLVGASAQAIHAEAGPIEKAWQVQMEKELNHVPRRDIDLHCIGGEDSSRVTAGARAAHWRSNASTKEGTLFWPSLERRPCTVSSRPTSA